MPELTLYNGDCIEIMKEIPDKSVDLIICDLPYGCLTTPRASNGPGWRKELEEGKQKTLYREQKETCAWDIKIDLKAFWEQVRRIRKDDHSPTIHFCTTKFGYELIQSNEAEFRYDLVWDKQRGVSFLSANKMPMRSHEMIYVFSKAGAFYQRKDMEGDFPKGGGGGRKNALVYGTVGKPHITEAGRRCVLSVVHSGNDAKIKGKHPTEKPCDLYKWLIERYCPRGGTVLDPTFGSGNSVFTAYQLGRSAIGIEKNEEFFKKSACRLDAL
jgi:site-specific DNA-methyltransferase (adenine-specific)